MKKLIILFLIFTASEIASQTPAMTRDALYYTTQQIDDPNTSGNNLDGFGHKIKVVDDTMLITAQQDSKVYVYNRINGNWTLSQTITPSFAVSGFGHSIDFSLTENLMVIQSNSHVFIFENQAGIWEETYFSIVVGGCGGGFGESVAIGKPFSSNNGVRIAVGACNYNNSRGGVSILRRTATGWVEDIDNAFLNEFGQPNELFGAGLAWSGQNLLVSATGSNSNTGRILQLTISENGPGNNNLPDIIPPNLEPGDLFGANLIASNNELIVASKGKVFVYLRNSMGFYPSNPNQELIPETNAISNLFGQSLSYTSSGFAALSYNGTHIGIYVYSSTNGSNYDLMDIITSSSTGTAPITPNLNGLYLGNSFGVDGDTINPLFLYVENGASKRVVLKLNRAEVIQQTDLNILSSFYSNTNGDNWVNNANWTSNLQPRKWHGVRTGVINGAEVITGIFLANNNLEGEIPISFNNLSSNTMLIVDGNSLFGNIPNFSGNANLEAVLIRNNNYQFEDINVVLSDYLQVIPNNFLYSPQFTTDPPQDIVTGIGSNITLSMTQYAADDRQGSSSLNNQFQWFKDGSSIQDANDPTYDIVNAQESDSGVYFCRITNPLIPDLIIERKPISIFIDPELNVNDNNVSQLKIYPNPAKNWINVKLAQKLENSILNIYDLNGRLISKQKVNGDTFILNIEDYSSGIYIISLSNKDRILEQRFIKE
ncbi:T9SS type A sorting domain-containing protein [Marixanthomonas sp. SCSIO 43207]|uniref:T9SS type A sorting domain-containing protein n=1 Tax=Marixanthomonas sp. SCSIO 43207 TaxID=2779360 RepID=UPI001CA859D2|nr:T9SS type A sorting domain-containing protein [Marixanthomonas sp. SCSIO 43207]UAB80390.1 T9SS type A sorting domain-containing protein [Marixanthomonas sp. SCSIO 43207]